MDGYTNIDFWDVSNDIPSQVRAQQQSNDRKVKLTPKSFASLRNAVKKRQIKKATKIVEKKEQLINEYKESYTDLVNASNLAMNNKENDIESFKENIDELYNLKVRIINIESKLNILNNRLSSDSKKTKKASMHFETIKRIAKAARTRLEVNFTKKNVEDNLNALFESNKYVSASKTIESIGSPYDLYGTKEESIKENIDDNNSYNENPVPTDNLNNNAEFYSLFNSIISEGNKNTVNNANVDDNNNDLTTEPKQNVEVLNTNTEDYINTLNSGVEAATKTTEKDNSEQLDKLLKILGNYADTAEKTPIVPPTPVANENVVQPTINNPALNENVNNNSAEKVKPVPVLRENNVVEQVESRPVVRVTAKAVSPVVDENIIQPENNNVIEQKVEPRHIVGVTAKAVNTVDDNQNKEKKHIVNVRAVYADSYMYVRELVFTYSEAYGAPDYEKIKSMVLSRRPEMDENDFAYYFGKAYGEMFNMEKDKNSRKI